MSIVEIRAMNTDAEVTVRNNDTVVYVDCSYYDGMYCWGVFSKSCFFDDVTNADCIQEFYTKKEAFASEYGEYFKMARKALDMLFS